MNNKLIDKNGFLYVMTNPSMPGLVKVGMTKRIPTERTKDDDMTSTGIPTKFEVQYYAFFEDIVKSEKIAHSRLSKYHYAKEFFKTDVATAIYEIENMNINFKRLFSKNENEIRAEEIKKKKTKQKFEEEFKQSEKEKQIQKAVKKDYLNTRVYSIILVCSLIIAGLIGIYSLLREGIGSMLGDFIKSFCIISFFISLVWELYKSITKF
ncbi:MAG: GIY-YIG nuclease family protein [Desulfobacterales bacterium]